MNGVEMNASTDDCDLWLTAVERDGRRLCAVCGSYVLGFKMCRVQIDRSVLFLVV